MVTANAEEDTTPSLLDPEDAQAQQQHAIRVAALPPRARPAMHCQYKTKSPSQDSQDLKATYV